MRPYLSDCRPIITFDVASLRSQLNDDGENVLLQSQDVHVYASSYHLLMKTKRFKSRSGNIKKDATKVIHLLVNGKLDLLCLLMILLKNGKKDK